MSLQFCMLETVAGGPVAINVSAVVAVRADGGQTTVVYPGGQIAVKGVVPEVVLKMLGAATAKPAQVEALKAA